MRRSHEAGSVLSTLGELELKALAGGVSSAVLEAEISHEKKLLARFRSNAQQITDHF